MKEGLKPRTEGSLPVQMTKAAAGPGAYSPEILVLAPSRELVMQIETEAHKFTAATGITSLACYGGTGTRAQQLGQLRERPNCVVATMGRLTDFLDCERHWFGVKTVKFLILDEADHMLGEGLDTQIRNITTEVDTPFRQTMMFSATFDEEVRSLASWILKEPVEVRVGMKDPLRANRDVDQQIMVVKDDADKEGCLKNLIRKRYSPSNPNPGKILIFAADCAECDLLQKKITTTLQGAKVETLHANRNQDDRENAILSFRNGDMPVLIATGLAGRGLDVKDVQLVINYDPPEDAQDYVHRIGRTGRAGNKGTAITLLRKGPDGRAMIYITHVMRRSGKNIPKELIDALKQRRGRDMNEAAQALKGLVHVEHVQRSWAKSV
jgi:superfamily II DNA/RNA helicase